MPANLLTDIGIRLRSTIDLGDLYKDIGLLPALPSLSLRRQDVNRWQMAKRAAEVGQALRSLEEEKGVSSPSPFFGLPFQQHCDDMPSLWNVLRHIPVALGFSATAVIYGGLHALAWFAHFNSPTEKLLWRLSACAVMGGIPIMVAIHKLVKPVGQWKYYGWNRGIFRTLASSKYLVLSAYTLARLYLVVESFIQLSHLPAGVYTQPEWSNYFPHIG